MGTIMMIFVFAGLVLALGYCVHELYLAVGNAWKKGRIYRDVRRLLKKECRRDTRKV